MEIIHALVLAYAVPFYNFVQCFVGGYCPPVFWPWG